MDKLSQTSHYYKDSYDGSTCEISRQWYEEAKAKLAAYEDIGLTPDEVAELVHEGIPAALDKLAEYESTGLQPGEVRGLADAKEQRRLIELPGTIKDALSFVKLVHCVLSDKRIQRAWTFRAISNARTGERYTLADAEQFLGDFYSALAGAEIEAALAAQEGEAP